MSEWEDISTAPKDGTSFIGKDVGGDVSDMWWQPEFEAFISSCRQMVMAPGYTIDGKSSELHSPTIEHPVKWMPDPEAS